MLTTQEEFDLIAPVAVYLFADLYFRKEAASALKRLAKMEHPVLSGAKPADVLDGDNADFWQGYNDAFEAAVLELRKGWSFGFDQYGAKTVLDDSGEIVFSGDSAGHHAFYTNFQALSDRLDMHDRPGMTP